MKNYTAIYSTEKLKNIQYSFCAENLERAKDFCKYKFSVPVENIICHSINHKYFGKGKVIEINVCEENGCGIMLYVQFESDKIWIDAFKSEFEYEN